MAAATQGQIESAIDVAKQAGFAGWSLVTAVAVALAETGGSLNPFAHNTSGEDSRGLWQINVAPGAHPQLAGLNLYDPQTNANTAYQISSGGTNWQPWTTFTGGQYQTYVPSVLAALGNPALSPEPFTATASAGPPPTGTTTPPVATSGGDPITHWLISAGLFVLGLVLLIGGIVLIASGKNV